MNDSDSLFSSANSTSSTIRPRNRRLISFNEDNGIDSADASAASSSSLSIAASPAPSRGISPIPATHLPRSRPGPGPRATDENKAWDNIGVHTASRANGSTASSGLWDSWSSLQGLASTLLGSDAQPSVRTIANGTAKSPSWKKNTKTSAPPRSVSQWGVNINPSPQLAAGSHHERHAMVQDKKREALLLANGHLQTDTTGRYKRRDSDTNLHVSPVGDEHALVYVHKVQPRDTLAGVMIKYNCQQTVFRKVNRFWPNDNIQIRTHVFLPIEACGIRGKKIEENQDTFGLLDSNDDVGAKRMSNAANASPTPFNAQMSADPLSISLPLTSSHETTSFKHESWVRVPTMAEPIEILRIPRSTLGFFPPRRKSRTFSDASDAPNNLYSDTTPKTSFDMLRHPPTHAASQNAPPARRPLYTRNHRSSSISTTNANAATFAGRLKGPGGVGTLRSSNLNNPVPGPAEDGLNKMFAHHLPNLAPPSLTPKVTPRSTPRASTDSVRSNSSSGLGEMGGAIEGWVRKLGVRTNAKSDGLNERLGDLIELEGGSSSVIEEEDGEETPTLIINANDDALLRERFPPRGRVREAYPGKGKGKDD